MTGDAKRVRECIGAGADVNATDGGIEKLSALHRAVMKGHVDAVKALIQAGLLMILPTVSHYTRQTRT